MKDFVNILNEARKIDLNTVKTAIATVVQVRGSSYRSPGARMLIMEDGRWYGSISGGCLEGDALRKARQVMQTARPITVTYDTREKTNQHLGISLGCNGVIDVVIEPVSPGGKTLDFFSTIASSPQEVAIATIFNSTEFNGEKFVLTPDGNTLICFSDKALCELLTFELDKIFHSRKSHTRQLIYNGKTIEVFMELIEPLVSLVIFGAGFDARPVSELAKTLRWNVTVTDECVAHIAPLFFPTADKLSLCQRQFIDRDFNITSHTACVLMSHNYEYDKEVLKKLLKTNAPYIGILGPRKRFDKMVDEFRREGLIVTEKDVHRIHSPVGLDIGAETPDEIAVSIISEIQAKLHRRPGGFLKNRNAPIHERDASGAIVLKQSLFS